MSVCGVFDLQSGTLLQDVCGIVLQDPCGMLRGLNSNLRFRTQPESGPYPETHFPFFAWILLSRKPSEPRKKSSWFFEKNENNGESTPKTARPLLRADFLSQSCQGKCSIHKATEFSKSHHGSGGRNPRAGDRRILRGDERAWAEVARSAEGGASESWSPKPERSLTSKCPESGLRKRLVSLDVIHCLCVRS